MHKHATTDQVMVTHIKRQKARSHTKEEEFEFEWRLEMVLDGDDLHTMSLVVMRITDIGMPLKSWVYSFVFFKAMEKH